MKNKFKYWFLGGGIYWNVGEKFSLVSKVSSSQKLNTLTSMDIYDPADATHQTKMNDTNFL